MGGVLVLSSPFFFFFSSFFQKKQDRSPLRGTLLRAAPGAEAHILSEGFPEAFRNTAGGVHSMCRDTPL